MRYNSLNEALLARDKNLVNLWTLGTNVNYSQDVRIIVEDNGYYRHISVYRDNNGMYEEAITYITGKI